MTQEIVLQLNEDRALQEYRITPEDIKARVDGFLSIRVPPGDEDAYKAAHKKKMVCVRTRTGIDKRRKELGTEARKWLDLVNGTAKELTALIEPAEAHLVSELKAEDDRKAAIIREAAEKEEARRQDIEGRISKMNQQTIEALSWPIDRLEKELVRVGSSVLSSELYGEHLDAAMDAREILIESLTNILACRKKEAEEAAAIETARKQQEEEKARLEEQQKAIEAERAAIQEEKDRIAREAQEKAEAEAAAARAKQEEAARAEREAKEAEEKKRKEAEEAARLESLKPDRQRIQEWLLLFSHIVIPDVDSKEAHEYLNRWDKTISELLLEAKEDADKRFGRANHDG